MDDKAKTVSDLKAAGDYYDAGCLAYEEGRERFYGAHFGMRSSRARAMQLFFAGYDDSEHAATREFRAKKLCFADCSAGVHLDFESGCVSICRRWEDCQGWRAYVHHTKRTASKKCEGEGK